LKKKTLQNAKTPKEKLKMEILSLFIEVPLMYIHMLIKIPVIVHEFTSPNKLHVNISILHLDNLEEAKIRKGILAATATT
jgi:hypothetical protein